MTTLKQILEAADPGIPFAAAEGNEALLQEILAIMCLDDKAKRMFEAIIAEGFAIGSYTCDDGVTERVEERVRQLRDRINAHTDGLREMFWPHKKQ